MVFSSALFVFLFLPITILGYGFANEKYKNGWLFLSSLLFYAWGEPRYVILMIFSISVNYIYGLCIEKYTHRLMVKKIILWIACVTDLGILFVFKYFSFFVHNINRWLHTEIQVREIALPIGISFFTFQILSYVIDVYRGEVAAQKKLLNLGMYITFFPQLIAGPIVRYSDVNNEIENRSFTVENFYTGIKRFILGFAKKVLVADNMAVLADKAFGMENLCAPMAWCGIVAYMLQIYYDFSGYSDMAIGIGRLFGFHFVENFNYPYISRSIKEFWRRWHISLSSWFRDYVYIPLGGSRCSTVKTYRNLLVVFLLTGIWHGASWNYVLWGVYYGVFLVLERVFLSKVLEKVPQIIQHMYSLLIIMFGWVLFRADNLHAAINYYKAMFRFEMAGAVNDMLLQLNAEFVLIFAIGIFCSAPVAYKLLKKCEEKTGVTDFVYLLIFIISILYMTGKGFSPFLYFRF